MKKRESSKRDRPELVRSSQTVLVPGPPALAVDSSSLNDIIRGCRTTIFEDEKYGSLARADKGGMAERFKAPVLKTGDP
jgi:hypothetical protein